MSTDLQKLEQSVEQEMDLLRTLRSTAPPAECLAHVKTTIATEAVSLAGRRRVFRIAQIGLGIAAAGLLGVAWWIRAPQSPAPAEIDPDIVVTEWTAALDESNSRLASLAENDWTRGDPTVPDEDAELDGLFRSLDQSFEQLGAL